MPQIKIPIRLFGEVAALGSAIRKFFRKRPDRLKDIPEEVFESLIRIAVDPEAMLEIDPEEEASNKAGWRRCRASPLDDFCNFQHDCADLTFGFVAEMRAQWAKLTVVQRFLRLNPFVQPLEPGYYTKESKRDPVLMKLIKPTSQGLCVVPIVKPRRSKGVEWVSLECLTDSEIARIIEKKTGGTTFATGKIRDTRDALVKCDQDLLAWLKSLSTKGA